MDFFFDSQRMILGAIGIVAFVAFWMIQAAVLEKDRTFEDYKRKYPECFKHGRVTCSACGGTSIYLRKVGEGLGFIINAHVCRQCGTDLYRTPSKV
jgi:hypothetical protein